MKKKKYIVIFLVVALIGLSVPFEVLASEEGVTQATEAGTEELAVTTEVKGDLYTAEDDSVSDEELFNGYVESLLYPEQLSVWSVRNKLTGVNQNIFDKLKEQITKTARGEVASTEYTVTLSEAGLSKTSWTAKELGVTSIIEDDDITLAAMNALHAKLGIDQQAILSALLADCPYELYWFDKIGGVEGPRYSVSASGDTIWVASGLEFDFHVVSDYATGTFEFDTTKITGVTTAIANAQSIVEQYKSRTDYEKLDGYRKEICDLVSYNSEAASSTGSYGDPWQIIYVFDKNPVTNVVCEGYAKAFQYLCDKTSFHSESVNCISVTGMMTGGSGAGAHMWNIVTMDDGKNYLVDVTNCDAGTIGADTQLFLKGYTAGNMETGYTYSCVGGDINFSYDSNMTSIYETSELTLSNSDYDPVAPPIVEHVHDYLSHAGKAATCTEAGWDAYETCKNCDYTTYKKISAFGHNPTVVKGYNASCKSYGRTDGLKCSKCGAVLKAQQTIAPIHKVSKWKTTKKATVLKTGQKTGKCSVCKKTVKQTIAKVPATIKVKSSVSVKVKKSTTIKVKYKKGDGIKSWYSSNKRIATVTKKGKVTGKSAGTAILTVKLKSGKTANVIVSVR